MQVCSFLPHLHTIIDFDPDSVILLHWGEWIDSLKYAVLDSNLIPQPAMIASLKAVKVSQDVHTIQPIMADQMTLFGDTIPVTQRQSLLQRAGGENASLRFTMSHRGMQVSRFPPVEVGSGQAEGQSLEDFLLKHNQWDKEVKNHQTETQQKTWEEVAKANENHTSAPLTLPHAIFVWHLTLLPGFYQ